MSGWLVSTDSDGKLVGFYHPSINSSIPEGCRPITDDMHQTWVAEGRAAYRWPKSAKQPIPYEPTEEEKLAKARPEKLAEIRGACSNALISGFISDCLGDDHLYPTKDTDRENVANSFIGALGAKQTGDESWKAAEWCQDPDTEEWAFLDHDAEQMIQPGKDLNSFIQGIRAHNAELVAAVDAATTEAQVVAIRW